MKKIILLSFISAFLFSCSSDDDGGGTVDQNDYFPVTANAVWFYDYSQTNHGTTNTGNTIVDINGHENFDGVPYQILDNTTYLIGSMNQIFFKKTLSSEVTIRPMVDFFGNFEDFGDLSLIKNRMVANEDIGYIEHEIVGDLTPIPANESNITGTVTPHTFITITNKHIGKPNNMSVNGVAYQSINHQKLIYKIKMVLDIDASVQVSGETIQLNRSHEIVAPQQYGTLDLFMAKDVGIIQTDYNYSFNNLNLNNNINVGGISIDISDFAPEVMNLTNAVNMQGNSALIEFSF